MLGYGLREVRVVSEIDEMVRSDDSWRLKIQEALNESKISCKLWKRVNSVGTTNIWHNVPINIPPTAAAPKVWLPFLPTPVANIIGNRPTIMW